MRRHRGSEWRRGAGATVGFSTSDLSSRGYISLDQIIYTGLSRCVTGMFTRRNLRMRNFEWLVCGAGG